MTSSTAFCPIPTTILVRMDSNSSSPKESETNTYIDQDNSDQDELMTLLPPLLRFESGSKSQHDHAPVLQRSSSRENAKDSRRRRQQEEEPAAVHVSLADQEEQDQPPALLDSCPPPLSCFGTRRTNQGLCKSSLVTKTVFFWIATKWFLIPFFPLFTYSGRWRFWWWRQCLQSVFFWKYAKQQSHSG